MTQPIDKPPMKRQFSIPKTPKTPKPRVMIRIDSPDTSTIDTSNISSILELSVSSSSVFESDDQKMEFEKKKSRKKSIVEEKIEKKYLAPETERVRKKSLKERRNSTADLTIEIPKLEDFHEIPTVRQSNIPSHYEKWTPEDNPFIRIDGGSALVSPVLPNTPIFDLKSIVNEVNHCRTMENERSNRLSTKTSMRMENIRRKMKPILIKKQPSTKSLPDMANHI